MADLSVQEPRGDGERDWLSWLLLVGILFGTVALRLHLADVPLERDEGEYAYGAQLLLQGIPPYQLLYNMKLPGIYAAYALVLQVFGQTHTGIHLGLAAVNALTVFFIFLVGRAALGSAAGLAVAVSYAVLSVGQPVQGAFANAEHFVVLPVIAGTFCLWRAVHRDKIWSLALAGFLLGCGFVVKQHGALFIVWGFLSLLLDCLLDSKPGRWKRFAHRAAIFLLSVCLPYLITCLLLYKAGVFQNFWFWTVDYARAYTAQVPLDRAWDVFRLRAAPIVSTSPFLAVLGAVGGGLCLLRLKRKRFLFFLSFFLCSFLSVCPGLYFRPHYFVLLLPAFSLLVGVCAFWGEEKFFRYNRFVKQGIPLALVLLAAGLSVLTQRQYLFFSSPEEIVRKTYWPNPFVESLTIADFIRNESNPSDTIAIVGSEPQIYFYSQRRAASGYIYMYPLMERHDYALQMQKEMITEVETAKPLYLIFVGIQYSWLQKTDSHTLVFEWFPKYKEGYERVGLVEIFEQASRATWGKESRRPPVSPYWIEVLRRRQL